MFIATSPLFIIRKTTFFGVSLDKYMLIGLSLTLVMMIFVVFTDEDNIEYDYIGIVHDVSSTSNGYTFYMNLSDGSFQKCYFKDEPILYGYYSFNGTFSDNGDILFISEMNLLG